MLWVFAGPAIPKKMIPNMVSKKIAFGSSNALSGEESSGRISTAIERNVRGWNCLSTPWKQRTLKTLSSVPLGTESKLQGLHKGISPHVTSC